MRIEYRGGAHSGARGGNDSIVFRPAPSKDMGATLGALAALTLLVSAGVPLTLWFASLTSDWSFIIALALVSLIPFLAVVASYRLLRYEVDAVGVTVHHLGKKVYRWSDIESVRVWHRRPRGLTRSAAAVAVPGFCLGRFRESQLGPVQMYATDMTPPFILLRTRSVPVVLSPDDVDTFVAAVRKFSSRLDIVDEREG